MSKNITIDVPINELMREVVTHSDGKQVAVLAGYVSSTDGNFVKFHTDLDPSSYLEIPKEGILHSTTIDDKHGKRNKLIISQDTKLVVVTRDAISAGDLVDGGSSDGVTEKINLRNIIPNLLKIWNDFVNNECVQTRMAYDRAQAYLRKHPELSKENRDNISGYMEELLADLKDCPSWAQPVFG